MTSVEIRYSAQSLIIVQLFIYDAEHGWVEIQP